jgi:CBS domain.
MQVRDAMSKQVLLVGPEHTLRQAASMMATRRVGSAVVIDPDAQGIRQS